MRYFLYVGPEDGVYVGARDSSVIGDAKFIGPGQTAVLQDDDPRCDSLAASPSFQEVDENGEEVEAPVPEPVSVPAASPPPPAPEPEPVVVFDYPTVSVAEPVEPEVTPETDETPADEPEQPKTRKRRASAADAESEVGAA